LDNEEQNTQNDGDAGEVFPLESVRSGRVRKSSASFTNSVVSLGGGSALAQVIGILAMPIIARLFLPEAFGTAALFLSFSAVIGCLATLRYEMTIVLPGEDAGAANILVLCLFIVGLVTAISCFLTAFLGIEVLRVFNAPGLIPYRWLFPVSIFITGCSQTLRYWNTRNKYFNRLAAARVAGSVFKSLGLTGSGLSGFTSGGHMIIVRLIGKVIPLLLYSVFLLRYDLEFIHRNCHPSQIWAWAKRYKRFPLIDSWTALLNVFSVQVAVMVLMKYFGSRVAGFYSQSLLLLWMPASLVGAAISQVSFQRFADHHASGKDISLMVGGLYKHLFSLGFLPFAMLVLIGPNLFGAVLGLNWVESGVFSSMLAPWIFINFLYSPLSSVIYVFEKQHANLVFSITLITSRLTTLLFGACVLKDSRLTILLYGLVNLAIYLSVSVYLMKCARVSLKGLGVHAGRTILLASPFLGLVVLSKWALKLPDTLLLVIVILLSLTYLSIIISRSQELRAALVSILKKSTARKNKR